MYGVQQIVDCHCFSVLACFLVPAPSLQMGVPASRGGKDWMRGLPQENSQPIGVCILVVLRLNLFVFYLSGVAVPLLSGCHTTYRDEILRTKSPQNRQA
jgi:hypothetical protein